MEHKICVFSITTMFSSNWSSQGQRVNKYQNLDLFYGSSNLQTYKNMFFSLFYKGPEPQLRDFHTAVCIDHKMYLFGGRSSEFESGVYLPGEKYCPKLWYLDLVTYKWHKPEVYGDRPIGRRSHSACMSCF